MKQSSALASAIAARARSHSAIRVAMSFSALLALTSVNAASGRSSLE